MSWLLLLTLLIEPRPAIRATTRIKELSTVEGVRDNQLIGYGLVVGLAGTGDRRQTVFSAHHFGSPIWPRSSSRPHCRPSRSPELTSM
jgi:flagellar P-ring protein precursor FlgI